IALFLTCARIGTAHAKAPPNFFGISDPFEVAPHAKDVRRMASGGVGWAHTGFVWSQLEPSLGHFNWDRSDNIIGNLASRGIHVFPYVLGSPGYAAKAPNRPPLRSKRARKAWKGFLRALANRYGRGGQYWTNKALYRRHHPGAARVPITSWQIWHEPNLKKYFHATIGQYAKLLRISHRAIHGADPHAKVILAGLPAYAKPTAWGFLNKLYRQKHIKKDFDGVAVHPYAPSVHLQAVALKRTRRAIKRHHGAHTPILITELGWGSRPPKSD